MRMMFFAITYWLIGAPDGYGDEPRLALDDITLVHNLQYREGVRACTLDLAMPKRSPDKPRPAIVVIHGGGWLEGDKSSFTTTKTPGNILDFARLGFVAVTINYRLSGEAPFPAGFDDCQCAVRWLRAHAGEYHVDGSRIGAWGNSAGGHLALLLGMMPPASLDKQEPYAERSSQVQAVVSDSGPIDLTTQHQHNQLPVAIEKFMGGPPEGPRLAEYKRASPVNYVREKIPPLLLLYGEIDTQVDVNLTDQFVAHLSRGGGKDVSYIRLANVDHCPHSLVRIPYLQQVVDEFFLRTLWSSTADLKR
ncbi:MAG: alpha/beta hydrolase [Planctomycetia bacterium]|nr:alpha/beta hydrolase [Planctomycetia bacterium]